MRKITHLIVHHTATSGDTPIETAVNSISNSHKVSKSVLHPNANGYGYHVAYHFLTDKFGEVRATRPIEEVGHHCGDLTINNQSIAIAMLGNYTLEEPTEQMLISVSKLIKSLRETYNIPLENVKAHRDIKPTECPGISQEVFDKIKNLGYLVDTTSPSPIHKEAWEWATNEKITNGERPKDHATREEVVALIRRYHNLKGNFYKDIEHIGPVEEEHTNTEEFEPSPVHKEAWEWGTNLKVTNGEKPRDHATREEVVELIYKYYNIITTKYRSGTDLPIKDPDPDCRYFNGGNTGYGSLETNKNIVFSSESTNDGTVSKAPETKKYWSDTKDIRIKAVPNDQ